MENEEASLYRREDDFDDFEAKKNNNNLKPREDNPLLRTDFQTFLNEEISEPDISYWCADSEQASDLLRKCIKMMNDRNWKGIKSYMKTCVDSSEEEFEAISSSRKNSPEKINKVTFVKNFYLGVAHFKEGEYDEALNCFYEANKMYQYYQLHYNLALCCMKKGMLEEAVLYLDGVITKNNNFFFAYYNLIRIYLQKRNPSQAYVNYRRLSDVRKNYKIIDYFLTHLLFS
jgi:tetratricopeptide (TPR) repeat protein